MPPPSKHLNPGHTPPPPPPMVTPSPTNEYQRHIHNTASPYTPHAAPHPQANLLTIYQTTHPTPIITQHAPSLTHIQRNPEGWKHLVRNSKGKLVKPEQTRNGVSGRGWGAPTGEERKYEMKKTGRTRARSRGIQSEERRQPDFANLGDADAPDTLGTHASTMEGTPPELEENTDAQGVPEEGGGDNLGVSRDERSGKEGAGGSRDEGAGSSEARMETEGDSAEGSLSEAVSYTHLRAHETDSYL
eukprot:23696-Pleurochrysis_carterae.AAC.2